MKGKGRIYRRPGKNFLTIAYWGPKVDGTRGEIRESAKTLDENVARKLLDERLRAVANARDGIRAFDGPRAARLTFGDLLDAVKADWELREIKSLSQSLGRSERLRVTFGNRKAMTITTDVVRKYIAQRKAEGLKPATINRFTEIIGRAFQLAIDDKTLVSGPKIPHLPEKDARQGFFEPSDHKRLLPHLPKPLDGVAILAYAAFWRRGELLGLRWEWVDRSAREINLPDSKNGEPRMLPLDEALWAVIEEQWAARRYETKSGTALSAYVFHRKGRPIYRNTFLRQSHKACVAAGLGRYVEVEGRDGKKRTKYVGKFFHDYRRSGARNAIRAGVPESVVMAVGGWKTRSVLDRYNITSSTDKLEALRRSRAYTALQQDTNVSDIRA